MPIIGNIGPLELLLVLALVLLILGPGKLPEAGAAFGRTIREFRRATTEVNDAVTPATPATPPPASSTHDPAARAPEPVSAPAETSQSTNSGA